MRILILFLYCTIGFSGLAWAGEFERLNDANLFCGACSAEEVNAFVQAQDGLLKLMSFDSHGRCNTSGDCPGSSLCKDKHCVTSDGKGTECERSGQCPGSSLCKNGRCITISGNGTECERSGQCPGAELCVHGFCH